MDWAEEKYDVSAAYSLLYFCTQIQRVTAADLLCVCPETPDCSGEDGAEGAVPLHPSAHVLGSL